jgi:hypothetical protein
MRPARAQEKGLVVDRSSTPARANRRRHARFPLGLPVALQVVDRPDPIIVEIVDVSEGGLQLRALGDEIRPEQRATLRFVLADQRACAVEGHVLRIGRDGTFVLELDKANATFSKFLKSLAAEALL